MLEYESLKFHAQNYYRYSVNLEEPSESEKQYALKVLEEAYKSCRFEVFDDFLSYESYLKALCRIDNTSSPGYPYVMEAPTNGDWLGFDGVWYDQDKIARLWLDVQSVLNGTFPLYLTCFVKQEPHKWHKIKQGRWRLIMASPLSVQIVWHMLFDSLNDLEIANAYEIPSQQGIKLVNGGWKIFLRLWKSRGYDVGLDKTAWDWTCPYWLILLDLQLRYRLAFGSKRNEWYQHAKRMYTEMFEHPVVVLSSGVMFKQVYPGIMKSGCVNTISINSHAQVFGHVIVCKRVGVDIYPLPVACGDDTLQCSAQVVDINEYKKLGILVKSASEGLEFVGHDFHESGPVPLYFSKHLVKLLTVPNSNLAAYFDSMLRMYIHSPEYDVWERLKDKLGLSSLLYSKEYYSYWYDFEE